MISLKNIDWVTVFGTIVVFILIIIFYYLVFS